MYVVCKLTQSIKPRGQEIANIDIENITDHIKNEAIENTFIVYDAMGGTGGIAKGKEFVTEVLEQLKENIDNNTRYNK